MGLKKWMAVVKSEQNGTNVSSRKQDRKKARQLRKLQSVAHARHQPIEKVMEEAFKSKKMSKKQKRKLRRMEAEVMEDEKLQKEEPKSKRRRKGDRDSSESDSDAELTYEQYLQEVQEKKRKIAVEGDDERQDDIDIHRYSKLLGIKEGKTAKKPKSFTNDGLDYLLDFCDSDSRKRILATSTDQEISLKADDLSEEDDSGNECDDNADFDEQSPSEEEELGDEEVEDEAHDNDDVEGVEDLGSENDSENDYKEDIYGRTVNKKTGKVVSFDIRGAHKKLEELDAKGDDSESKMKIDRILMGTLNRLSEGTLIRGCHVVSDVWQNNSKNGKSQYVKSCLTHIFSRLICAPYRLQDQLLSLYALFLAQIHSFTSEEISAYFVEVFLRGFIDDISRAQTQDDKKLENSVVFIAHLLNFHVSPLFKKLLQARRFCTHPLQKGDFMLSNASSTSGSHDGL
ncbi:MI domain-containing protein [Trichostrongylus colubriformis]|uniref:MI domain-containing protein n=1 Tax=Trichostrongylus colubriformis TaxID=6319 RepID=A0AAN8EWU0_TRICO